MMRDDQRGRGSGLAAGLARDRAQRLAMQVIEVRMRYQDHIHRQAGRAGSIPVDAGV